MKRIEVLRAEHPEHIKNGNAKYCVEEYGFKGKEYCSKKHDLGIGYLKRLRCKICWLHKSRRQKEEHEEANRRRYDLPETREEEKEKSNE